MIDFSNDIILNKNFNYTKTESKYVFETNFLGLLKNFKKDYLMSNSIRLLLNKIRYYILQTFLRKFFFRLKSIFFKLEQYKSILSEKPEQLNTKTSKKIWIFDYTSFFHTPSKAFHGMMLFANTLSSNGHSVKFIKCNGSPNACNIGFKLYLLTQICHVNPVLKIGII